jgi:hypothetical protein
MTTRMLGRAAHVAAAAVLAISGCALDDAGDPRLTPPATS